jgi:hypothetical protein
MGWSRGAHMKRAHELPAPEPSMQTHERPRVRYQTLAD